MSSLGALSATPSILRQNQNGQYGQSAHTDGRDGAPTVPSASAGGKVRAVKKTRIHGGPLAGIEMEDSVGFARFCYREFSGRIICHLCKLYGIFFGKVRLTSVILFDSNPSTLAMPHSSLKG